MTGSPKVDHGNFQRGQFRGEIGTKLVITGEFTKVFCSGFLRDGSFLEDHRVWDVLSDPVLVNGNYFACGKQIFETGEKG